MARITRTVRVRPGSSKVAAGGHYGEGDAAVLVVRVTAPAVDGRATEAVLKVVATALGVPKASVSLLHGASSRTKVLVIDVPDAEAETVARCWADLMADSGRGRLRRG
ncbi:MAG: DUF167 domain-containing protein [Actinobacteria bacterium]|nr:DUF167 domain-containing protein [Actinomycetota bacterium]